MVVVGGGKPGSEGKKTPSVFPAGMLMAGVTCGRLTLALVGFLADQVLFSSSFWFILYPSVMLVNLLVTTKATFQNPRQQVKCKSDILLNILQKCYPSFNID